MHSFALVNSGEAFFSSMRENSTIAIPLITYSKNRTEMDLKNFTNSKLQKKPAKSLWNQQKVFTSKKTDSPKNSNDT